MTSEDIKHQLNNNNNNKIIIEVVAILNLLSVRQPFWENGPERCYVIIHIFLSNGGLELSKLPEFFQGNKSDKINVHDMLGFCSQGAKIILFSQTSVISVDILASGIGAFKPNF